MLECQRDLVQELAALFGSTVTGQLIPRFLNGELVVVGELLSSVDLAQGEDDNVLLTFNNDDARVAVGLTGMVYETRCVAMHCGVHHLIVIDPKHVTANPLEKMTTQLNYAKWLGMCTYAKKADHYIQQKMIRYQVLTFSS